MLGLAVRVLPGRRRASWPPTSPRRRAPASRCSCAAMRTSRTSASSPRPSGGSCSTSTTSTRRSRAVGVGRQAARGELVDRGARRRLPDAGAASASCSGRRGAYRERDGALRRHCGESGRLVCPGRRRGARPAASRRELDRATPQASARSSLAKARTRDSLRGTREAHAAGRRRAAHRPRPAADRADRRSSLARRRAATAPSSCTSHRAATAARSNPTGACCSSSTAGRHRPQGRRRRQRRYARLDRCSCSAATAQDPLFLQIKEAERRCSSRSRRRERVRQRRSARGRRASGSCRRRATSSSAGIGSRGTSTGQPRDFYVRQLRDWKGSADVDDDGAGGDAALRRAVRGRRSRGPTRAPATASRSPPIWAPATPSTARGRRSPSATPTRTSATTPPSPQRRRAAG